MTHTRPSREPDGTNVRIRYHRPPDRERIFEQAVVHRNHDAVVTLVDAASLDRPVMVEDDPVLEKGSPAVWFTFRGEWHDIGRFHRADGSFTGLYANILTPVIFHDATNWETTDLFLDIWIPPNGAPILLDVDELHTARVRGWLDKPTASRAREEADRLMRDASTGDWPPAIVNEWTLERARRRRSRQ